MKYPISVVRNWRVFGQKLFGILREWKIDRENSGLSSRRTLERRDKIT